MDSKQNSGTNSRPSSHIAKRNSMARALYRRQMVHRISRFRYASIVALFLSSIICIFKDWRREKFIFYDHIMYLSFFLVRFFKIFIEYRIQSEKAISLWEILWKSPNFHALLFQMSLYISRINSLLFILESIIYSFRKLNRFISIEVAPLMKLNEAKTIEETTMSISKNQTLKLLENLIQFSYLPYLIFITFTRKSGRAFLSTLVNIFVYSPFLYIYDQNFNSFWKSINYTLTGYVLDNSTKKSGKLLSSFLDYFQQLVDLIAVCYPYQY